MLRNVNFYGRDVGYINDDGLPILRNYGPSDPYAMVALLFAAMGEEWMFAAISRCRSHGVFVPLVVEPEQPEPEPPPAESSAVTNSI